MSTYEEDNKDIDSVIMQERRARQLTLAFLRRCHDAGIPEKYFRISEPEFFELLDHDFYGGKKKAKEFSISVYNDPSVLQRDFITIDGGNEEARYRAGFALLFRIISYDKIGLYQGCNSLTHKFQTFKATEDISRNDLAEDLKKYEVLFIGEYSPLDFASYSENGSFFDEFLTARSIASLTTIISFVNPIAPMNDREDAALKGNLSANSGRYLANLAVASRSTNKILRIRVKNYE